MLIEVAYLSEVRKMMMNKEEKLEKAKLTMKKINKKYPGAIKFLGKGEEEYLSLGDNDFISTGSLTANIALGGNINRGFGRGRVIEIYGGEGAGKSSLLLEAIAQEQKKGNLCALVEPENALNYDVCKNAGVDLDELVIFRGLDIDSTGKHLIELSAEDMLESVREMIKSGVFSLIGIDSVPALSVRAELDKEMGQDTMGGLPKRLSEFFRKVVGSGLLQSTGTTLVFINQVREKIGVMYGSPIVTPGGRALKFYASQRISLSITDMIKGTEVDVETGEKLGQQIIGHTVKGKVIKNKLHHPYREFNYTILYETGLDRADELKELALKYRIVKQAGAWIRHYTEEPDLKWNGRGAFTEALRTDEDLFNKIQNEVMQVIEQ